MSDTFPLGHGGNPALSVDTFTKCHEALAHLIDQETPTPPHVGKEMGPPVDRGALLAPAMADLDHWSTYAIDGDPVWLASAAPWIGLEDLHVSLGGQSDALAGEIENLTGWTGSGGNMKAYLDMLHGKVEAFGKASTGDTHVGCYVAQVGSLVKVAIATQAAFKKDLYEIAKTAHQHLKAIDDGGPAWKEVGMLLLGVVGLGLSIASGEIASANWANKIFRQSVGAVVGKSGDISFSTAQSKFPFDGVEDPAQIMRSLTVAVNKAVETYTTACTTVSQAMSDLWRTLTLEYNYVKGQQVGEIPKVDTTGNPSFAPSAYGLAPQ